MKRFPLVLLVWLGCSIAWMLLGTSLVVRTGDVLGNIGAEVRLLWGPEHVQGHPSASFQRTDTVVETVTERDAKGGVTEVTKKKEVIGRTAVPLRKSDIQVALDLTHRRKGLMWFPTYASDFAARYTFENPSDTARVVDFSFPLGRDEVKSESSRPSPVDEQTTIFDGFTVTAAGAAVPTQINSRSATWSARLEPHERREFGVRYRSRGTSKWSYRLTDGAGSVEDFTLAMTTNFKKVDFAPGSISPTRHGETGKGWSGTWRFESLVASAPIAMVLPEKLNPGPIASRITYFAPVGLLFFVFVVVILASTRGLAIHPMNYFFFGCGFFAFHLLFAYLVDHLAIVPSFTIASAVSVFLVVSYARLFTGWDFALRTIGIAQIVYLVLFSSSFFWDGFTGLAITVGAILTLFVMMQVTGRIDWNREERPLASPKPA